MRSTSFITIGLLALFVVLVGAGCFESPENPPTSNNDSQTVAVADDNDSFDTLASTNTSNDVEADILESDTKAITVVKSTTKPSAKALSYAEAVRFYDDIGYRYQFADCSGLPGTFTVKRGVKFMLDNRDSVRHVLSIGTSKYTVPAYGYAIVSVNTPNAYYITCDGGGSAEIKVQI